MDSAALLAPPQALDPSRYLRLAGSDKPAFFWGDRTWHFCIRGGGGTDPPISNSHGGGFMLHVLGRNSETGLHRYTNNGQLFGDWIGREDKGGQTWITYHLSGNEWIQVSARNQKAAKDFIASSATQYGTTLNDMSVQAVKRIDKDFEIDGTFTFERFKAPIYLPGLQTVTTTNIRLTWYPSRQTNF